MTAVLWQERAPHGPWFVRKADGRQVSFESDKADAEEFCAAINGHDALMKALEGSHAMLQLLRQLSDARASRACIDEQLKLNVAALKPARETLAKVSQP